MRWSITRPALAPTGSSALGWALAALAALAMVAVPAPLNLLAIPAIAVGVACVRAPAVPPVLLVASVPIQAVGAVAVSGVQLTATKAALAASAGALLLHLVTRRDSLRWSSVLVPYGAYLLVMVASLYRAQELRPGIAEIYRWSVAFFALVVVLYGIRSRRAALAIPVAIGAGVLLQAGSGAVQSLQALGPASFAVVGGLTRAYGTFGKPNTYGAYLELSVPLLLAVAMWSTGVLRDRLRRYRLTRLRGMLASRPDRIGLFRAGALALWMGGTALAGLLGIILSFSRGAWLGTAAGLLAMVLASVHRAPVLRAGLAVVAALAVLAVGMRYAPPAIQERYEQLVSQVRLFDARRVIVTDENFAAVERMAHWQTGVAMFEANPFLGVGVGNFNVRFREFHIHPGFPNSAGHAHNYYIHAAAETGVFGLAAYLWLIGTAFAISLRAARTAPDSLGRAFGVGSVGMTAGLMVHNIVENLHVLSLGIHLAAIWALAAMALHDPPWHEPAETGGGTSSL
ncbi:MAG: O-antigen ligase family protein [Sphaerobacter sp.]|nr:O-antigen ligase family protein [Sphaerobacter sp.]